MKSTFGGEYIWYLILRYVLGLIMVMYGLIKILGIQFPTTRQYTNSLNDVDGVTLTWAFLGYSTWFVILLGLFELVPAVLLLFRKTKLVGAILLFPVLLNVFLINNAYGFYMYMRVFTGVLLAIDLILILVHYKLFIRFFKELIHYPHTTKWPEIVINCTIVGVITLLIFYYLK
ncbi:hypothetical protein GXP67_34155 [Rhodocytophaga rosea]|uniref:DoxX family membrane protein n=1 Tax=Rhodocytophaga rosea TaxID=2704465 RepID=A0A6C0GU46_9BACT|nr:DoxX family membrane protein [Rhodocytophaga rosea]QHT71344.1 hypothetical protein GXP67_34155 [Rhodocytophaga rosea]